MEDRLHKANCERSFTLAYKHLNCVFTINMGDSKDKPNLDNEPIMLSNLDTNSLESFGSPGAAADQGPEVKFN